jgi:hypothetical protein
MNKILIVIIVLLIILFICYLIVKAVLFNKLNLVKNIIKSPLNKYDMLFLKGHSDECDISSISSISSIQNKTKLLFYTDTPWSTKNDNHLLNISENKYYIVDKGYIYYLHNPDDYKLFINAGDVKIRLFNFEKYHKKINYI